MHSLMFTDGKIRREPDITMISIDLGVTAWPCLYMFQLLRLLLNMPSVGQHSKKHLFISDSVFPVHCYFLIEY